MQTPFVKWRVTIPVLILYIYFFRKCARIASRDEKDRQFHIVSLCCNSYSDLIIYIR